MRSFPPFRWIALLPQSRLWQSSVWPGLLCGVLFYLLSASPPLQSLERSTLDFGFRLRGARDADPRVVVIQVDDEAINRSRRDTGYGYPLPRSLYAAAIQKCKAAGAKAIALDVLFMEPGPAREDAELVTATAAAGSVVHASVFRFEANPTAEVPASAIYNPLPAKFAVTNKKGNGRAAAIGGSAFSALADASMGMGHVTVFPEEAGVLRRVPHLIRYKNRLYPSLALAAVAAFDGIPQSDIVADQYGVRLGTRSFPLDANGDAAVNWIGANESHPSIPLYQLLDGLIPEEALRGRLVLFGVTAEGAYENRATPFSTSQPAVEFQANAIDNLLSNRPLIPVNPLFSDLLLLCFPMVCSLLMGSRWRGGLWVMGIGAALALLSIQLLIRDLYLPVSMPLLAGAVAVGMTASTGFRREWDANARADASVAALARGTTLLGATLTSPSSGAASRERLQSVIRVTARETLGAKEVFLVLVDRDENAVGPMEEIARRAAFQGHTLLWPPAAYETGPKRGVFQRLRWLRPANQADDERLFDAAAAWVRTELEQGNLSAAPGSAREIRRTRRWRSATPTLIVAPLPSTVHLSEEDSEKPAPEGALIAVDRRDGSLFTPREAVLLEALARQAAIALANWEYGETLRGRVELANRELRTAYRLLSEQSAKLFSAVESIEAAIVVSDQEGRAVFVNASSGRTLRGATPILGESVAKALAAGDLDELAVQFESFRLQGKSAEKVRAETMRGREILSAQLTPLIEEGGHLLGAMLVVSDVTAQRELDRMKTDFVGFVAHELRTPLTTILGYASLLDQSAGRLKPEQMHDMTTVITRHCRRMNRLINDLLDISRIEAGQALPLQQTFFDMSGLLQRLVEEQRSQLNPFPPIAIELDLPDRPVEVMGDPDRMEQVVINLLTNAVKYSPDGGEVRATLTQTADTVQLTVKDQGMGMTEEQVSNLFQKFYRTPDARSRGIKGTGLGLHLVKQIIESHGGRIEVESSIGRGTLMRITLPAGLRLR